MSTAERPKPPRQVGCEAMRRAERDECGADMRSFAGKGKPCWSGLTRRRGGDFDAQFEYDVRRPGRFSYRSSEPGNVLGSKTGDM